MNTFPRTNVGGISVSRMIMGTNWLLGYSHTGAAADEMIKNYHSEKESQKAIIKAYLSEGVDTIMGPFSSSENPAPIITNLLQAIKEAEEETQKKIIIVDTPHIDVDDNAAARESARQTIKRSRELGASIVLIHHAACEQLVNKNTKTINRLDDYTAMIRDEGLVPGLSAHMPEMIVYSDENGYDVETYIQIYNCMGFLMQVEIESVSRIIHNAKKPVMTIKPMAAGRCTPYVGFNFVWNTIRDCDMVTVGAFNEKEVYEDIEISRAALERRFPNIQKRSSPVVNQVAFGK